jgi:Ca2+-binding EF-hand superfamily protein
MTRAEDGATSLFGVSRYFPLTFSNGRRPSTDLMNIHVDSGRRPRRLSSTSVVALIVAALGTTLLAQEGRPRGRDGEREGGFMRMNPLFAALDANGDGVIDEEELKNATVALKKLDRNNDGKLTSDEVRPAFGRGGPGQPGGGRGGPPAGAENVDEVVNRMLQFDKDADGRLSKDEVPERMQGMFERGDTNRDGFLSRDELVRLARTQSENRGREGTREGGPRNDERR